MTSALTVIFLSPESEGRKNPLPGPWGGCDGVPHCTISRFPQVPVLSASPSRDDELLARGNVQGMYSSDVVTVPRYMDISARAAEAEQG